MANQMTITFNVENQLLRRTDTNRIVEKSKNYLHANFTFSADWDNTTKAVIIENGGMRFKVYLENNECDIPNRAVSHDGFTLTVVGEDSEKFITITTTDLFIPISKNNAEIDVPKYVEVIESDTLDVTREGEKYNLEIPDNYITNTKLSQELENYVNNESLEETLEDYVKETDLSDYATKQELNGKSTVIPNPTLVGDEPDLEGAEIDGVKYKVGGGDKLYLHRITLPYNSGNYHASFEILSKKNSAYTYAEILAWLNSLGTGGGWQGGVPASTTNFNGTTFSTGVAYNSDGYITVFYWDGTKITRELLTNFGMTIYDNYIEV